MLSRLALPAVLLLTAALRLWRLDQNGLGHEYYTAGGPSFHIKRDTTERRGLRFSFRVR